MELQRLHRKIYRFRAIQIYPSVVAGSVPRNWLNASLLAQRLVAVSIFLTKKKNTKKRASYMPLSPLGMPPTSRSIDIIFFQIFHIRSPTQRDVVGSIFFDFLFYFIFFRSKKLS
jgi:hypothetical protein